MGPLLFMLFINDLPQIFNANSSLFADDNKVYKKIRTLLDCLSLQSDLDKLSDWCDVNRLNLNIKKCSVISFTRSPCKINFDYYICKTLLTRVESVKDLGVIFDSKLSFNEHVQEICKKAFRMLGFIFRSCKYFTNIYSLLTLYKSYVRSQLEYCSSIWSPMYGKFSDKIEKVQRRFTKTVFFKFKLGKVKYNERLSFLKLHSLESRRLQRDEIVLYKVIHGHIDVRLHEYIHFRNANRFTKSNDTFYVPNWSSNVEINSPMLRSQKHHDLYFKSYDIMALPLGLFKSRIKRHFPF